MKNITLALDEKTYRKARIAAARRDASFSSLVKQYLQTLAATEIPYGQRHRIVPLTVQVMQDALDIKKRYQTSYGDAAILEAAASASCTELLSENLNPGQNYNSVRVIHPFSKRMNDEV